MKRIVLIMQALLSVLIVNAQDFRNTTDYQSKIYLNDSLLLDTKLKDKDRCKYLMENNAYKDSIIFVLEEQLEQYKNDMKIKDFILCSDTTVFGSKFIELDIEKYPNRVREYYQLIYDLRNINQKLVYIEKIVNDVNTNELIADLNQESKCAILQEKTEEQILELRKQLLKFKERDITYLSEEQKSYYNEYLKIKFNNVVDVIYNN
ncbi:MAG: hypothetical protein IJE47_03215 [Bacteroidales bacterium]|nr:hypothetical protein [Bacteroidales bacterium]